MTLFPNDKFLSFAHLYADDAQHHLSIYIYIFNKNLTSSGVEKAVLQMKASPLTGALCLLVNVLEFFFRSLMTCACAA